LIAGFANKPPPDRRQKKARASGRANARYFLLTAVNANYSLTSRPASEICAQIKQRISIPWLWHYHNFTGDPKPGGRSHSPFYPDKNPDFCISRDGSWFKDWGEPDHKGDVISFEMLASGCARSRDKALAVWVRAPQKGPEPWTGFSRSKLYELAKDGKIRSVSIREPGQQKGTRLFEPRSILAFIDAQYAGKKVA
jgi:hypothetical protein